ncbi:MAG: VCBS repeat-containing protein [Planctomycetaceae bacterium]|nr:VCBS repeat-containing protein [Planctomycetaceae bacterium]
MHRSPSLDPETRVFPKAATCLLTFFNFWTRRQRSRQQVKRMRGTELLEDRTLLAALTVTNLNDSGAGSLRQAIIDANGNSEADTIDFQSGLNGTITLAGAPLTISSDVTISGPGSSQLTIDGNLKSRVMVIPFSEKSPPVVAISGLTIANGQNPGGDDFALGGIGGGINSSAGELTLEDVIFSKNSAQSFGGFDEAGFAGGLSHSIGKLTIRNSAFTENVANDSVGALFSNGSETVLEDVVFSGNKVGSDSFGILAVSLANGASLTNVSITGSSTPFVTSSGSAVSLSGATTTATNLTISGNTGGLQVSGNVEFDGLNFSGNGEGIRIGGGTTVAMRNSTITGNSGLRDSAAINNSGNLSIESSIIKSNQFTGLRQDSGELVLRRSEVSLNDTVFSNFGGGGGLELRSGTVHIINSTISGNATLDNGGGIAVQKDATVTITNSTVTGNSADSGGGGIWNSSGLVTLHNTIVGGNQGNGVASDIQGSDVNTASSAHNLIADAATSGGIVQGGDLANIVGLGGSGTRNISTVINTTLEDNGGNGVLSHALVPGSLAIDNGNTVKAVDPLGMTLLFDQNGSRRVQDGDGDGDPSVDIGAVEAGPMAANGLLIFDQSNGKWRLGTTSGNTLNWFETGQFGSNFQGFVGDFNGDGLLDGMMLNMTNLRFNFLRNRGDGTLAAPVSAGALSDQFTWDNFMVGDYDGNGRAEVMAQIVSTGFGQGAMRSQDFLGVNRFYVTMNTGFDAMATGDFNGDGWDDVVGLFDNVGNTRANIIPAYSIRTPVGRRFTTVLASGQFGQSVATGGLHDLTVDDFNGDGRDDIAVVNANGQIFTATTVGDPRVNADDVRNFVVSNASPRLDPATYSNSILSGGFNDDLLADILTIRDNDQLITAVSSLTSNGTPSQSLAIAGTSSVGEEAVVGDFNGDGLDDLIVLGATASQYLSMGTSFDAGLNLGNVIGGAIGSIGIARAGRLM